MQVFEWFHHSFVFLPRGQAFSALGLANLHFWAGYSRCGRVVLKPTFTYKPTTLSININIVVNITVSSLFLRANQSVNSNIFIFYNFRTVSPILCLSISKRCSTIYRVSNFRRISTQTRTLTRARTTRWTSIKMSVTSAIGLTRFCRAENLRVANRIRFLANWPETETSTLLPLPAARQIRCWLAALTRTTDPSSCWTILTCAKIRSGVSKSKCTAALSRSRKTNSFLKFRLD